MEIGNHTDATLAVKAQLRHAGGGCTRDVYIDTECRFVYKVEWDGLSNKYNAVEHYALQVMRRIRSLRRYAPPTSLFKVEGRDVLCMPFYLLEARYDDAWRIKRKVELLGFPLSDIASFNIKLSDRRVPKIIDAACTTVEEIDTWLKSRE